MYQAKPLTRIIDPTIILRTQYDAALTHYYRAASYYQYIQPIKDK
jgi:hypothetical protein